MIIDNVIQKQIDLQGVDQVVKRYSIMMEEVSRTMSESKDMKQSSILSDVENLLISIISGIKNQSSPPY